MVQQRPGVKEECNLMTRNLPKFIGMRSVCALSSTILVIIFAAIVSAQTVIPEAPVLISEGKSTRALAVNPFTWRGVQLPTSSQIAWPVGDETRVTLFVTNLELMKEEGANAFRADAEDASGFRYPLTVESIDPVGGHEWIYGVTIKLNGEIGDVGDVLVRVTWRGMSSNRTRLAIGHLGDGPKDDPGSVPTGAPSEPPQAQKVNGGDQSRIGFAFSPDRIRFMEQATFGPTADLDARLRRLEQSVYLGEQFDLPYPSTPYPVFSPVLWPDTTPATCTGDCPRDNYTMYPLQRWFYTDALYGQAQLRRRVSWALSQILVVSGIDLGQPSRMLPYIQKLDEHAFGNYRNLLGDITVNPAMGDYLDMIRSTKNNPNENFAREVLQLFSVGLFQLNQDGTLMLDGSNNPIPTYDQTVVNNFTKVFTGWILNPVSPVPSTRNYLDPLVLVQSNHDVTSKTLLSYPNPHNLTLPAGQNGATDLSQALDNIFYHPNVAPFVCKQLIQHLVTSDPTPAYVGRVSAVFNDNGQGVRGDLKAVVRAILTDVEARGDVKNDPNYGHLREPVLLVTDILRTFNARAANGAVGSTSDGYLNPQTVNLSQDVFRPPSVFNYYSPGYVVPGTSVLGPEFGIMTTSTSLRRINFVNTIVFNTIPVQGTNAPTGTSIDLSEMQALATTDTTGAQLVEALNKKMLHGTMSTEMRNIVTTAVLAVPSSNPLLRARQAIYLVASSSQYQVQR